MKMSVNTPPSQLGDTQVSAAEEVRRVIVLLEKAAQASLFGFFMAG